MITIIFDIDGTLVESTDFDDKLYIQAITEVLGDVHIRDDWNTYDHVTDSGILRQVFEDNNIDMNAETADLVRSRFGHLIMKHLDETPCAPKKGAIEAIKSVAEHLGYTCGIATGGWGHTAEMKLASAGIDCADIPIYSSDNHHERKKIMQKCSSRMPADCDGIVYVGDGPWDMVASYQLNWGFVGIGERLKNMADIWIRDFNDPNWKEAPIRALRRTRTIRSAEF